MKLILRFYSQCALTVFMLAVLVLILLCSGCIAQQAYGTSYGTNIVTVMQPDSTQIIIIYHGGPGMENLTELSSTVTDSQGKGITKESGSRRATTQVQIPSTIKFAGSFEGNDHVVVTGYFSDGKTQVLLDTTI